MDREGEVWRRDGHGIRSMSKLLMFVLLGLAAYLILRGMGRPKERTKQRRREAEQMVLCAHCGVHLPEGECLRSGEHCYCCEAHRVIGPIERRP